MLKNLLNISSRSIQLVNGGTFPIPSYYHCLHFNFIGYAPFRTVPDYSIFSPIKRKLEYVYNN
jgi:hypothetical protein